ncbi:hypothetical protein, partial [Enterobacter cloacae complex sp. 4DZ1-17B1]|uniref:hypothetical protein n=1 Tax=Enterobacter cloacae complex sp. 4DZ1-17B1 TaxID=2511991 RepID=UPI001CA5994C
FFLLIQGFYLFLELGEAVDDVVDCGVHHLLVLLDCGMYLTVHYGHFFLGCPFRHVGGFNPRFSGRDSKAWLKVHENHDDR